MTYRIVKSASSEDAEEVVSTLHFACFENHYWDPTAHWWLANDHTGGSVAFGGLRVSKVERSAYLCRAGVHPKVRGAGLQTKLIQARIKWARKEGLQSLITDTVHGNFYSANNLINLGFRMYNPAAPWANDDSSYWRLTL